LGVNFQHRSKLGLARKDAIAALEVLPHVLLADLLGGLVHQDAHAFDGLQRERAQLLPHVAPSVQDPVLAVVNELQGRDDPLGVLLLVTAQILQCQALALQQGSRDFAEMSRFNLAWRKVNQLDLCLEVRGRFAASCQD
jgi:hypothetical protein